ncbi:hypothetical protein A6P54_12995 [Bacillus sp. MKU004]|nr:hypothetical protein A6P54_12995 [Bacillus sp. MKU004]
MWSTTSRGSIFFGTGKRILLPVETYLNRFQYYSNGQLLWESNTPDGNETKNAVIASNGNVAISSARVAVNEYVQLFNQDGNELLRKKIERDYSIGEVLFNENGELFISSFDNNDTLKMKIEWYDAEGNKISESDVNLSNGLIDSYEGILKVDNNRNVWGKNEWSEPFGIYKYNEFGNLTGKTIFPEDLRFRKYLTTEDGVIFTKYNSATNEYSTSIYNYK